MHTCRILARTFVIKFVPTASVMLLVESLLSTRHRQVFDNVTSYVFSYSVILITALHALGAPNLMLRLFSPKRYTFKFKANYHKS